MKPLVLFYSHTGNNKFLAKRISRALKCDTEEIRPRMNAMFFQIMFSLMGAGPGAKAFKHDLKAYDRIVLCGPVWMGRPAWPLTKVIKKHGKAVKRLYFATCCGSSDENKDDKYGYNDVLRKVKGLLPKKRIHCEAFPIGLIIPEDKKKDNDYVMKARLSDKNFNGKIQERLDAFVEKVKEK
jgi:menaquinone-dependent protoporphyrinogen IX oxidase